MYVSSAQPYLDDFDQTKKFYRILFRPGRAIQARELTQLQTIIQNQLKNFGSNIFKEGSIVVPGAQFYEKNYNYVKLQDSYNAVAANGVLSSLLGEIVQGQTTGMRAKIVSAVESTNLDPPTIYVQYLDSGNTCSYKVFESNEILTQVTAVATPISVRVDTSNATGFGSAYNISSGIIFVKGVFAYFDNSTIILSKYNQQTSDIRVGFKITESVIDSDDDSSLLDPAVGSSNYFAPGADRYKLDLELELRALTFNSTIEDANFIELMRIQNNAIIYSKPLS